MSFKKKKINFYKTSQILSGENQQVLSLKPYYWWSYLNGRWCCDTEELLMSGCYLLQMDTEENQHHCNMVSASGEPVRVGYSYNPESDPELTRNISAAYATECLWVVLKMNEVGGRNKQIITRCDWNIIENKKETLFSLVQDCWDRIQIFGLTCLALTLTS